jgi:hypothetical protein
MHWPPAAYTTPIKLILSNNNRLKAIFLYFKVMKNRAIMKSSQRKPSNTETFLHAGVQEKQAATSRRIQQVCVQGWTGRKLFEKLF